jgi:hypothetical protein
MMKSESIKIAMASNIRVAMNAAEIMNLPLSHFVTINFMHTACEPDKALQAFRQLRNNRYGKWVTREHKKASWRPAQAAYVWVIENPDDITHAHWAVHLPEGAEAEFKRLMPKWLVAVTGGPLSDGALDIIDIDNTSGLALYMLKGADERYTTFSRIIHEPQGVVDGRRCGVAHALNRSARKAAGINGQRLRGRNRPFHRDKGKQPSQTSAAGI